jgi:hypothetical protein
MARLSAFEDTRGGVQAYYKLDVNPTGHSLVHDALNKDYQSDEIMPTATVLHSATRQVHSILRAGR